MNRFCVTLCLLMLALAECTAKQKAVTKNHQGPSPSVQAETPKP